MNTRSVIRPSAFARRTRPPMRLFSCPAHGRASSMVRIFLLTGAQRFMFIVDRATRRPVTADVTVPTQGRKNIESNRDDIRRTFTRAFGSSLHYTIVSTTADGRPHVTPIGSPTLRGPGQAIYFAICNKWLKRGGLQPGRKTTDGQERPFASVACLAMIRESIAEPSGFMCNMTGEHHSAVSICRGQPALEREHDLVAVPIAAHHQENRGSDRCCLIEIISV